MRKNYILKVLSVLLFALGTLSNSVKAQSYYTVGSGTTTTSSSLSTPFSTYWHDGRHQYLVLASELTSQGASGSILSLGFDVASLGGQPVNGLTIRLSTTTATTVGSSFPTNSTTVYSAGSAYSPVIGWNQFTFNAPFVWNGTDNIIVEVCFDNSSWTSNYGVVYSTVTSSVGYRYADNNTGCTMSQSGTTSSRPNIRFEFSPPLQNDAGIGNLISPSFPTCSMDSVLKVELTNYGTTPLTASGVTWKINSGVTTSISWTGNIASYAKDTITLGTVAGGLNDNDTITAWITYANNVTPDSNSVNDTLVQVVHTSLSGTYVIDSAGLGDFTTFTDAVQAMENYGICGDVIFDVAPGTYVEQISLSAFQGLSDSSTVTFWSANGDPSSVVLTYSAVSSSDNYVVNFDNTMYISFMDITIQAQGTSYMRTITSSASHDITISGCTLKSGTANSAWSSSQYATYIYGQGNDNWELIDNTIEGGSRGLYFYGSFSQSNEHIVVENNRFIDQYYAGAYIYYANDVIFSENYTTSSSAYTSGYGLYFGRSKGVEISDNHIEGTVDWPRYGLYCYYVEGDLSEFAPVINNRIYMPYTGALYGIYASSNLFVDFSSNSVYMMGGGSTRGIYATSGGYNKFINNLIQVDNGGYGIYISGTPVYEMDYNNVCAGNFGYLGSAYATLADWTAATTYDSNSLEVCGIFADTANLRVCSDSLYGMGMSTMYATDFEGDMRQTPPCIGADEFIPMSMFGGADDPVICDGDTLVLVQDYFDTVIWNNTDTSKIFPVTASGTVYLSVYGACGSAMDTINVQSQMYANVGDTNLCEGTSAVLETGISNGQYMWSNGSTDSTITVDSAQTIVVTVIDAYGCTSMDTAVITQSYNVNLGDSTTFCEGANVVLDANLPGTYVWSDGSSNQTLSVSAPGTYSVTVTDQNCVSDDDIIVTEILNVVPSFTDSSSYLTVVFTNTSQNATSYLWDFGDGHTSTVEHPIHVYPWTPDSVKLYTVTLTAYNSCGDDQVENSEVRIGQLVSVSELDLASMINVYPNPNNGTFNVVLNTNEAKDMRVDVMDARGALVYSRDLGAVSGTVSREITLDNPAQGIYFVRITLNGETAVYKLSVR